MSNNTVILIGNLGADPEIKVINNEKRTATFSLGVFRTKEKTDWFTVQFWGKQADTVCEILKKGNKVSVMGSISIDSWEKDGKKNYKTVISGKSFTNLTAKSDSSGDYKPKTSKEPHDDFADLEDDIAPF